MAGLDAIKGDGRSRVSGPAPWTAARAEEGMNPLASVPQLNGGREV